MEIGNDTILSLFKCFLVHKTVIGERTVNSVGYMHSPETVVGRSWTAGRRVCSWKQATVNKGKLLK